MAFSMQPIRIGCAVTRRDVFSAADARKQKDLVLARLRGMGLDVVDIDDINEEGLLFQSEDVPKIAAKFKAAGVAGVMFPHGNFGSEFVVAALAKEMGVPSLLWGPRDDAPAADGTRNRDTQCGLFATGKVMRRFNQPFSYIVNCRLEDDTFARGVDTFVRACAAVRAFRQTRVLQIAPRPMPFWTMMYNEGELLERFGLQVAPITLQDVATETSRIKQERGADFEGNMDFFRTQLDCGSVPPDKLDNLVALKTMIEQACKKYGCNSAAIQCWDAFQDTLGVFPCIVNGLMADLGIPVTCETDVHGAVTAVMLQAAGLGESPVFFADMTIRHPDNDNAELLWHCGNFPPSLVRDPSQRALGQHFINPRKCYGTGEWELKQGDITVCRFDGDHGAYSLLMGQGRTTEGPRTRGTYVWFEVEDWPLWEERLVRGPYVHHCAGVYGKVAPALYEACRFIPGLEPDAVEPTAAQIEAYLRA